MSDTVSLATFGERMEEMMTETGLTPESLKTALGIDISVIYSWLRNKYIPTFENIIKLADIFNCSVDFLAGLSNDDKHKDIFKACPHFGQRLRFLLNESKITEYRISKDTKISRKSFFDWFNGISLPYLHSLIKLANYLNCSIDYLVGRED